MNPKPEEGDRMTAHSLQPEASRINTAPPRSCVRGRHLQHLVSLRGCGYLDGITPAEGPKKDHLAKRTVLRYGPSHHIKIPCRGTSGWRSQFHGTHDMIKLEHEQQGDIVWLRSCGKKTATEGRQARSVGTSWTICCCVTEDGNQE